MIQRPPGEDGGDFKKSYYKRTHTVYGIFRVEGLLIYFYTIREREREREIKYQFLLQKTLIKIVIYK